MPITMPVSDLQRDIGTVYETCHTTQEPVYITRNGVTDLVIMDAAAFEREMGLRDLVYEREMRILAVLEQSEREIGEGRVVSLDDARALRMAR